MRVVRALLVAAGLAAGAWGLWLMRDFTSPQLVSLATWLAAGVIVHDALIGPAVALAGLAAARWLPRHVRPVAAIAFLVWATLTVAVANVLSGQGGKPDNDTILDRPYVLSWVVLTLALAGVAAVAARRPRCATATDR